MIMCIGDDQHIIHAIQIETVFADVSLGCTWVGKIEYLFVRIMPSIMMNWVRN